MALDKTLRIRKRLQQMGQRERRMVLLVGLSRILIAAVLFAAVFFLLDWMLRLSAPARLILVAGGVAAIGWVLKTCLLDPLKQPFDEESVALKIEKRFPEIRDRLISVVQLTGGNTAGALFSPVLIQRLEEDAAGFVTPLDFAQIIDWRFIRRVLLLAGALVLLAVLSALQFPNYALAALQRLALSDQRYPTLTQIEVLDHPRRLVRGENWTLKVNLNGRLPHSAQLWMRPPEGEWETQDLKPELGRTYAATIEKVQGSFEYRVFAGDDDTEPLAVEVLIPVAVEDPFLRVTPPAYTQLAPEQDLPILAAKILEGSQIEITVPTTKPVVEGELRPARGAPVPLSPLPDGRGAVAKVQLRESFEFTVVVKDGDGLCNEEPRTVYRLRPQPDRAPKVTLLSPQSDKTSVPWGKWPLRFRASDDFGVMRVWLAWRVDRAENAEREGPDSGKALRAGRDPVPLPGGETGEAVLDLVLKSVKVGEKLTAWIEAEDARAFSAAPAPPQDSDAPLPSVGRSKPVVFRIVDEQTKRAEIEGRLEEAEREIIDLHDQEQELKGQVEGVGKKLKP